jgi:hypothetical protein
MAHSWPKRRLDDWLNNAETMSLRSEKHLQMSLFRGVCRGASSCPSRPVTPEVAGSSPVAPVFRSACKQPFVLPDQAAAYCPWPNPVARGLTANSLQIALFAIELVARSHEQEQVTGCSLPVRAKPVATVRVLPARRYGQRCCVGEHSRRIWRRCLPRPAEHALGVEAGQRQKVVSPFAVRP